MKYSFLLKNTLAALVLAACAQYSSEPLPSVAAEGHAPEQGTGLTEQKLVYAKDFMAASGHPLATEPVYDIVKSRGSAIDARTAILTTLWLTAPQSSCSGSGTFLV